MTIPLIIIDVQKGFINAATAHLPPIVEHLQDDYDVVIPTRFVNPEGSAHRRLIHWQRFTPGSAETEFAFSPRTDAIIIEKTTYSCLNLAMRETLNTHGAKEVHMCGIATDNCVLASAIALFESGFRPMALASACASHAGTEYHQWGLKILRRLIGEEQVTGA